MRSRVDGRNADEMRVLSFDRRVQKDPQGSVLVRMGDTHVLCAATVEESVPPFLKGSGKGWVTGEYAMLPAATQTRMSRGAGQGRSMEIQRLIGRSLRAVTDLEGFGERTVRVDCDVIQADGGTRTAAITGGFVVLVEAFQWLKDRGEITNLPIKDKLAAISVGVVEGHAVLDLNYAEDSVAEVDMNVVMTGSGEFVEIQGTAEGSAFGRDLMNRMLDLAWQGIEQIHKAQMDHLEGRQAR